MKRPSAKRKRRDPPLRTAGQLVPEHHLVVRTPEISDEVIERTEEPPINPAEHIESELPR